MIFAALANLADTLDKKGHRDLADLVDGILKSHGAEEASEDASADEASADEAPADAGESEEAEAGEEVEEVEEVVVEAPAAEVPDQDGGMVGGSWYGEGPMEQRDLGPVPQGTMLDKRSPLPGDQACAEAAPAPANEPPPAEGDDQAVMEAAAKLVELAGVLDSKGYSKEADLADQLLQSLASLRKG